MAMVSNHRITGTSSELPVSDACLTLSWRGGAERAAPSGCTFGTGAASQDTGWSRCLGTV